MIGSLQSLSVWAFPSTRSCVECSTPIEGQTVEMNKTLATGKTCKRCGIRKDLSEYNKDQGQKSGLRPSCRSCGKLQRLAHGCREIPTTPRCCRKCGQSKSVAEFSIDRHSNDGLHSKCRDCNSAFAKVYLAKHRARLNQKSLAYQIAHQQEVSDRKIRKRNARLQWVVYGISFPDGKVYVGSTIDFKQRLDFHRHEVRAKLHHNRQFNGYRPDDLAGAALAKVKSKLEARQLEAVLVHLCQIAFKGRCLNILSVGGQGVKRITLKTAGDQIQTMLQAPQWVPDLPPWLVEVLAPYGIFDFRPENELLGVGHIIDAQQF